jgi:hypothetical protein
MIKISENCRYKFTRHELVDIARRQASLMNDLIGENESFDQLKADHKSKVSSLELGVSDCTRRITAGFEMRSTDCLVLKFRPDNQSALVIRLDSGRVLRQRRLDESEKQVTLSDKEPDSWIFETDFCDDAEGDILTVTHEHVPLTAAEAEALRGVTDIRPLRPLIGDGSEAGPARGKRKPRGTQEPEPANA